jgi:hypothetical protein
VIEFSLKALAASTPLLLVVLLICVARNRRRERDTREILSQLVQLFCERRMEEAYRKALDVYYTAEELARNPEHAELLPHVDAMRQAHEAQYGRPIPPKQ